MGRHSQVAVMTLFAYGMSQQLNSNTHCPLGASSVAFSPDGRTLASGSWGGTIRLWDTATAKQKYILIGHTERINSVAFSPDGQTIASGSGIWTRNDNTIRLWDTATAKQKYILQRDDAVNTIAFSPDGQTIASGSYDTIRLWDVATAKQKHILIGHKYSVNSVAFSPDGQTIASGGGDNTIRLWDTATAQQKHILQGHTGGVNSIAFSPGGNILASGSRDGTVLLWELEPAPPEAEISNVDVNGDGNVNIQDLVAVAAALGQVGENDADVNGDGNVNIQDLVAVAAALGQAAAAPSAIRQHAIGKTNSGRRAAVAYTGTAARPYGSKGHNAAFCFYNIS